MPVQPKPLSSCCVALEKPDWRFYKVSESAFRFVLDKKYENGGWPRCLPVVEDVSTQPGHPDTMQ